MTLQNAGRHKCTLHREGQPYFPITNPRELCNTIKRVIMAGESKISPTFSPTETDIPTALRTIGVILEGNIAESMMLSAKVALA